MGHWLDGLLEGGVKIEWDGVPMTQRAILNFGEQFSLSDDAAGNKINVALRFMGLDGDVTGDSDENLVTTISGDEEESNVVMRALSLVWDAEASEGVAEIVISQGELDAGALVVRHNDLEVFAGVSSAPRFGNSTSVSQWIGGQCFSTRIINSSPVVLDTPTKDMVVHVLASAARDITIPLPVDGRTVIFLIAGGSAVTLKRRGSELINGSGTDYVVPFADACVVLSSVSGNWLARSFADSASGSGGGGAAVGTARRIDTTAPLTGGGDLSANRTLGIDPTGYVAPTRTISVTAPLTGGGTLAADRTIGIDTSGLVATTRTIATTAPVTGGGALSSNLTIALDPAGYVAPSRTISVSAPLTGGGDLSANRTIGIDTSGFVGVARLVNTTAPLTGGGALSGDLTLAISGATALAMGVVMLAGNLTGTAAVPLVKGLTADTITVQNTDGSQKGAWTTAGLRVGDNNAPAEKLDVLGNGRFGSGNCKVTAGGVTGTDATQAAVWIGTAAPSTTNYTLFGDTTFGRVRVNAPTILAISFAGADHAKWNTTGLRIASDIGTPANKLEVGGSSSFEGNTTIGKTDNTSAHTLNGAVSTTTRSVSADVTVDTTTKDLTIFVDSSASSKNVTLPTPTNGRMVWVKRVAGSNNVNVNRSGSAYIETAGMFICKLITDGGGSGVHPYVALQADGTNWHVMRHFSILLAAS